MYSKDPFSGHTRKHAGRVPCSNGSYDLAEEEGASGPLPCMSGYGCCNIKQLASGRAERAKSVGSEWLENSTAIRSCVFSAFALFGSESCEAC